jgi:hydrogenase maturation factor HypF (carbamoyltransferase family)
MKGEPKGNKREAFGEPSANQWRTVGQVAQLEGLTPRAVQRRCQAGKYITRRVEGSKGEVWEIEASSIGVKANQNHEGKGEPQGESFANASPNKNEPKREPTRREDELREEIRFLRALVEGLQQSEAQTKAALREALKAMPKELPAASNAAQERAINPLMVNAAPVDSAPAQVPANRPQKPVAVATPKEPRPLWKLILGIR